jgi:hypothetical protein
MQESAIEKELCEAAVVKEKKNEDRQKYLSRLMRAVSKLPDPEWEALSKEAQDWNNGAAEAHKAGDELEDFPDYEEVELDEEEAVEEVAPKTEAKKAVAKPDKAAKSTGNRTSEPSGTRKVSACHTIKKIVVKNPTITVAQLSEQLKEAGLKVSEVTIATLRSDLRDTLRVLNEVGVGKFSL